MISKRLKELRKEKGITQYELADALSTNRPNIAAYEQGISEPSIEMLIKMASYFNVTVDYLIGASPYKTFDEQAEFNEVNFSKNNLAILDVSSRRYILDFTRELTNLFIGINNQKNQCLHNEEIIGMTVQYITCFSEFLGEAKSCIDGLEEDYRNTIDFSKIKIAYSVKMIAYCLKLLKAQLIS